MMFYTGIGSRETPQEIQNLMFKIAQKLDSKYILRSGGADGADLAFEKGSSKKEIYIPWRNFNSNKSNLIFDELPQLKKMELLEIASEHHPNWKFLKSEARKLMARNVAQIKGYDNTYSKFVICYTKDGCESHLTRTYLTGGTGLAISLASSLGIPVFNLKNNISLERLVKFIS